MNISSFFEPVRIGTSINVLRNTTVLETYTNDNANTDDRVCSICQNTYTEGVIIRKISHCNHFYHHHCLDQWLENNTKCPECQYDIRESVRPTTSTPNTSSATPQTQRQTPTQLSNNLEAEIDNFVTTLFQNRLSGSENRPPIISSVDILIPNSENGVTSRNLFRSSEQPRAPIFPQQHPQPQQHPPQPRSSYYYQPQPQQHYYHPQPQQQPQPNYYQPYVYPQSFNQPQSTLNERRMIGTINRLERIVNQLQQQSRNQHQPRNQSRNNNQSRHQQPGN